MKTTPAPISLAANLPLLAVATAGLLAAAGPPSAARAAIQVVAPTASAAGSFTITDLITFTVSVSTPNAQFFVLDEWVTSDGSQTNSFTTPTVLFSINGVQTAPAASTLIDNSSLGSGQRTPNDGAINFPNFTVAAGDIVTLGAATYSLGAASNYNPQTTQTFTGSMFMTASDGTRISDIVSAGAVPEPGAYALALLGGAALLGAVRRSRRAVTSR